MVLPLKYKRPSSLTKAKEIFFTLSRQIPFTKEMVVMVCAGDPDDMPLVVESITHEFAHYFALPDKRPDLGRLTEQLTKEELDVSERSARLVDILCREFLGMTRHHVLSGDPNRRPGGKQFPIHDIDMQRIMELSRQASQLISETASERAWPEEWFKTGSGFKRLRSVAVADELLEQ